MNATLISFVVPVLNEAGKIGPLLAHLRSHYPGSQCVVVDGGSSDNTVSEARLEGALVYTSEPGRAVQMNHGAKQAQGRYVFFLHADTLPTICAEDLQRALEGDPMWGFFRVRLSGSHWMFRLIERAMNVRSRLSRVATGDQLLFIRLDLFTRTGGYKAIPLMEDIEYSKRLRHIARPTVLAQVVETSSRRWESQGIVFTVVRMWCLRLAYFLGVSPARLKAHYANA